MNEKVFGDVLSLLQQGELDFILIGGLAASKTLRRSHKDFEAIAELEALLELRDE